MTSRRRLCHNRKRLGAIRAMVGSENYAVSQNQRRNAAAKLWITLKPFVYLDAINSAC